MSSVTTDTSAEFDVGPLSWVQGEIEQALTRAQEALAAFRAAPQDATPLKHARAHVHQAAGAIQMVGLDALVAFTDEIERGLTALDGADPAGIDAACGAIDRACRKLAVLLAGVVQGAPMVALDLFPEYEAMQRARGIEAVAASDLFYPDLSPRAPPRLAADAVPAGALPAQLMQHRRAFQHGLLAWLRGDAAGARAMRDAVAGIEAVTAQANPRAFWWTVGALMDAIVAGGLAPGFGAKQLTARIDLQIRRVVEGSTKVADRLRREVLYHVAISAPVTPVVRDVQQAFRLAALLPAAESPSADAVRLEPLLRAGREQIGAAKDAWLKFTSGRSENLPLLRQTLDAVHRQATQIGNAALARLTESLAARLPSLPAAGMSEAMAMEFATGLLLVENAFAAYSGLTPDFPRQVEAMLARLDAVAANRSVDAAGAAPLLDEMSKRAQERLLLAQVVREIQVNLRRIEQVLDAFFRDHAKRSELATLARDSHQIGGALRILGLDQADALLALCQAQIEAYANPETPVSNDDLELLAESLSSLGFYVEAVEQQRPDRERLIAPLLARLLGQAPEESAADRGESAESAVEALRAALPEIVAEVRRAPADAAVRAGLRTKLTDLRDDARLIGDESLAGQAEMALRELDGGGTAALTAAVDVIAGTGAAAPAISAETQRLLATDENALDAEFVEIYLTEAGEVLDAVAAHRAILGRDPGAREALRTVRRGFHTLKGSGRMVGLTELGELAFDVERTLNRLLEDERAVTPAVLAMIDVAEQSFRAWVSELRETGRVRPDPGALDAAILAVQAQFPGGGDALPRREAPAAPAAAAPPAVPTPQPPEPLIEVIDLAELPEVGADGAPPPEIVALDEDYGDGVVEVEPAAGPSVPLEAPGPPAHEGEAAPEEAPADVTFGGVTLSASLYRILCDEADSHLAALSAEFEAMQFDPRHGVSAAMVRAGHTLCGIHRTAGFPLVAQTARALEQCLLGLQHAAAPLPDAALPTLATAIAGLADLVARIKGRMAFTFADEAAAATIQAELDALRAGAATGRAADDAEALAAREAARDDEAAPPVPAELAALRVSRRRTGCPGRWRCRGRSCCRRSCCRRSCCRRSCCRRSCCRRSCCRRSCCRRSCCRRSCSRRSCCRRSCSRRSCSRRSCGRCCRSCRRRRVRGSIPGHHAARGAAGRDPAVPRGRHPRAGAGARCAHRCARRRRRTDPADLSRGGGGAVPQGERGTARVAQRAFRRALRGDAAAHAAHAEGQRADGGGHAAGRAHAPHGVAAGGQGGRDRAAAGALRRARDRSRPDGVPARRAAAGGGRHRAPVAARGRTRRRRTGHRACGATGSARACRRPSGPRSSRWRRARPRATPSRPRPASGRCCACAPTSSIVSRTRPARWRSPGRASTASCARSRRTCSS